MDKRTRLTIASYDKVAKEYAKHAITDGFWRREFDCMKKLTNGRRVLEIGSGAGRDAKMFLKHGYDYLGTDASRGLLRVAKRNNPAGTFRFMNVYDMRFQPHSFDIVWCIATLLHVPKRRVAKVLRSMRKLLTDEGVAVFSMKQKHDVDEIVITQKKYGGVSRFFAFYSKPEFVRVLRATRFRVVKSFVQKEGGNVWLSFVCRVGEF